MPKTDFVWQSYGLYKSGWSRRTWKMMLSGLSAQKQLLQLSLWILFPLLYLPPPKRFFSSGFVLPPSRIIFYLTSCPLAWSGRGRPPFSKNITAHHGQGQVHGRPKHQSPRPFHTNECPSASQGHAHKALESMKPRAPFHHLFEGKWGAKAPLIPLSPLLNAFHVG